MLSLNLRFVLQLIFILHYRFRLVVSDSLSLRNQCHSYWHYIPEEKVCIIFTTTQGGDVSWYDGYKACQTSSSQLLTVSSFRQFQSVQKKFNELKYDNEIYLDYIQRGVWITNTEWSMVDLCDSTSTTINDLLLNCNILTVHSDHQSLCLKRASCRENHPFICQSGAMTERELIESTMERLSWWKCIVVIWCIVDDQIEKQQQRERERQEQALAAQQLQNYINQFEFELPEGSQLNGDNQTLMMLTTDALRASNFEMKDWMFLIGGGFITVLMICACCTALVCVYRVVKNRRLQQNASNRDGSFDSIYSTVSR